MQIGGEIMSKTFRKDLTGQRFGRLTVLGFVPTKDEQSHWLCICDCGNKTTVVSNSLTLGHTQSCGCLHEELIASGKNTRKHGESDTRLYTIWSSIKSRCYNKKNNRYQQYGNRGIAVCNEWKDNFAAFKEWAMTNGYDDTLTIDRINVNGNYECTNCRWISQKEQQRNKRSNKILEYKGKKMSLAEAAEKSGINYATLKGRYNRGDRGERLFRPVR